MIPIRVKNISSDSPKKAEICFKRWFYDFLYYRPEENYYSSKKNIPKVKLPRSRHK